MTACGRYSLTEIAARRAASGVRGLSERRARGGRGSQPALGEPHPHRAAERDQGVIEVVAGVMQHARACPVPAAAMRAIAVADQKITARLLQQEETEVFGPHPRLEVLHV